MRSILACLESGAVRRQQQQQQICSRAKPEGQLHTLGVSTCITILVTHTTVTEDGVGGDRGWVGGWGGSINFPLATPQLFVCWPV